MASRRLSWILPAVCGLVVTLPTRRATAGEQVITLDGMVQPGDPRHVLVPFDVPAGTVEIEVRHDDMSADNILDWGLLDQSGHFRGWGGGNSEPAVVGGDRAARSYITGSIAPGSWSVVVGKAKIVAPPATYHLEIHLRDAQTLAAQPERQPYRAAAPLVKTKRYYAGDLHVHSKESGDASPTLDAIADLAEQRGLDFVELSDHNTISQLDFIVDAQSRHKALLFVPGVEWTSYAGHGNGIGATQWVDHKLGINGVTAQTAADAFAKQGALFGINHPTLELGDLCIGCGWHLDVKPESIATVEVINGAADFFTPKSLQFWDKLCDAGHHVAAVGGSDDHSAGMDEGPLGKPIGTALTMVLADELSVSALLDGIRAGRTVVRRDPDSPMVELTSSVPPDGDTISGAYHVTLHASVTKGLGHTVHFVHDGKPLDDVDVKSDPFEVEVQATAPAHGQDRWRVEVSDARVRTVTSHLWIAAAAPEPAAAPGAPPPSSSEGCACSLPGATLTGSAASRGPTASTWFGLFLAVCAMARRRRA